MALAEGRLNGAGTFPPLKFRVEQWDSGMQIPSLDRSRTSDDGTMRGVRYFFTDAFAGRRGGVSPPRMDSGGGAGA